MIALLPVLLITGLVGANDKTCPAHTTDVRLLERIQPPRVDLSKSEDQLLAMPRDEEPPADSQFTEMAGLTVASITVESDIETSRVKLDNGICVWPSTVTVTLSTAPVVYIAAGQGACQRGVALAHEMQHVEIDRQAVARYVPIFRQRLQEAAEKIEAASSAPAPDTAALETKIGKKVDDAIADISNSLDADVGAAQTALDSVAEYERLSEACPADR